MRLFEILLPQTDNDGQSMRQSFVVFEAYALHIAGGFTKCGVVEGQWRNDNGTIMTDYLLPYRVACSPAQWAQIVSRAFALWPDQEAICHSHIGECTIELHSSKSPAILPRMAMARNDLARVPEFDRNGLGR